MVFYAGIDLGGTKIAAGILDTERGELIAHEVIPTQAQDGVPAIIARMADLVHRLQAQTDVTLSGTGIGVPAVVDYETGRTLLMPNLPGWYEYPVVAELSAALTLPVAIINDARAFTLAEATLGAGRSAQVVAGFTLGTGVGGGIAFDGKLYMGLKGAAGELGHQTVDPNGPKCGCGNYGCLEMYASGPAIVNAAAQLAAKRPKSQLHKLMRSDRLTPELIQQAALNGDGIARNVLKRAGAYLGIGFSNILTMLAPDCIVVGGGVAQLGDMLLQPAWEVIRARCHTVDLTRVHIVQAELGRHAGLIGAALWALQQLG
jgi:glucokinase